MIQKFLRPLLRRLFRRIQHYRLVEFILRIPTQRIRADVADLLKRGPSPSIWFLPTQSWYSTHFQRPQQMARALAEIGCTVIYWEPWWKPSMVTKEGVKECRFIGLRQLEPNLYLLRFHESFLQDLLAGLSPDAILMMWPQQSHHIPNKSSSFVIYDIIDDSSLVPNANENWHAMHKKWILCADIVTATADILLDQASQLRSDVISLPNAVRLEDWQSGNAVSIPQDIKIPRNSRVVVGYYGALAEWMDWQMWEYAAQAHQDWSFVLIGPSYGTYRIPPEVQNLPNLFFLGPKPYHELPAYLSFIDVVTIPFLLNDITHACSPVKLFEYMASGKPIVATPMREILKYHSVMFAGTYEQFVTQLEAALAAKSDPEYQRELQQEAEANTWRARAVKLRDALITSKQAHAGVPRRQRNKDDCSGAY